MALLTVLLCVVFVRTSVIGRDYCVIINLVLKMSTRLGLENKFTIEQLQFVCGLIDNCLVFVLDGFKKTVENFKNIDILINNAGIMNDRIWEKEIAININGTIHGALLGIQKYIPKYKSGSEGVIVNISSIAGSDPAPILPIYSATKYAVIGLTRSFGTRMHYKLSNVRIFAVCPGFTNTPLIENVEGKGMRPEYASSFLKVKHMIGVQEPEELAEHVVGLIERAPNGSVWVLEEKQPPYELKLVTRHELREMSV